MKCPLTVTHQKLRSFVKVLVPTPALAAAVLSVIVCPRSCCFCFLRIALSEVERSPVTLFFLTGFLRY